MKKYLFIFNWQTYLVVGLAILSSFITLRFQIRIYFDFIFLGLFIAFPLTFSLREAFRRRERALRYLSVFSASLQSSFCHFENAKLERFTKQEFRSILTNISNVLMQYLSGKGQDAPELKKATDAVFIFVRDNREKLKGGLGEKVLSFQQRINECVEFLLATKRHRTPWGVRAMVILAVYVFAIFYPASLLADKGFNVASWHVFTMTAFKSLFLISLCNVQLLLEDPFDQQGADNIRLDDFQFTGVIAA